MIGALLGAALLAADGEAGLERVHALRLVEPIAAWRVLDLDGDGADELLTVDRAGRVAVRRADAELALPAEVEGGLALPHPERTLLALIRGAEGAELFVVDPDGVRRHGLADGGFAPEGRAVADGARNALRLGRPTFAPLADDVNGDGRVDLILPAGDGVDLWIGGADGDLARAAHVAVPLVHRQRDDAELLSDRLSETFRVPRMTAEDVNGDGRADLVVEEGSRRAFHLQAPDGAFPREPDVELDLSIFRDTSPQSSLAPGRTLVLDDRAVLRSADLDGDGIRDHVVAHRRKVWVFPGGADGPQFTRPSQILKTGEDVTTLALVELDGDERPDLLAVKLVVPSIGAIVVGILGELDVTITAAAYRNEDGEGFATRPMLRSELVLRLPPLAKLLSRPEDAVARLEEAAARDRPALAGDFDGDGVEDVALVGPEARSLELWRTASEDARAEVEPAGEWLRRLLFDEERRVFDLDRVAELLGDWGDRRTRSLTGGRPSDARIEVGEAEGLPLAAALPADLDGDGRDEVVLGFEGADGLLVLEVLAYRADGR